MQQFLKALLVRRPNGSLNLTPTGYVCLIIAVCLLNFIIFYLLTGPNFAMHR